MEAVGFDTWPRAPNWTSEVRHIYVLACVAAGSIISDQADLGAGTTVGKNNVIGENVVLGRDVATGAAAGIGNHAPIGTNVTMKPWAIDESSAVVEDAAVSNKDTTVSAP